MNEFSYTNVFDRELVKENSFIARWFYFLDKISCILPDALLFDTEQHIRYFRKTFGIKKDRQVDRLLSRQVHPPPRGTGYSTSREDPKRERYRISSSRRWARF